MILILYMLKTYTTTTQIKLSLSQIFIWNSFPSTEYFTFCVLFFPFYLLIKKFIAGYNQNT